MTLTGLIRKDIRSLIASAAALVSALKFGKKIMLVQQIFTPGCERTSRQRGKEKADTQLWSLSTKRAELTDCFGKMGKGEKNSALQKHHSCYFF